MAVLNLSEIPKDHIRFRQLLIIRSLRQRIRVHHTAVITRPVWFCSPFRALNLDVEFLPVRKGVNVKTHIMTVKIFQCVLRNDSRRAKIRLLQDNLQDQIDTGKTVLKHRRHKDVIHQC